MTETYYHFISSARQGLAAAIDSEITDNTQKRAQIDLLLNVARRSKTSGSWDGGATSVKRSVQLYGPGDVVGFDERMVVRTDPKPDSGNFEPNYFPAIEFADFDFPWRFSPKKAYAKGFTPWIVLIVLIGEDRGDDIRREYEEVPRGRKQLPLIKVFNQQDLPDLNNAWRWAHVQAMGQEELSDEDLEDLVKTRPECVVSRLMCPRRLQPKTLYSAFVVPAYKLGWAAGVDTEMAFEEAKECNAVDPSWVSGPATQNKSITLPYYYRWDFRTSVRGDFEYLVRSLEPRKLEGLGLREIDCQRPGFGLTVDSEKEHILDMEGALQSLNTKYSPWGKDRNGPIEDLTAPDFPEPEEFQDQLAQNILNKGNSDRIQLVLPTTTPATPTGFEIIKHLAFDVLKDGKSVRVFWITEADTTGRFEYGQKSLSGTISYSNISLSDSPATQHSLTIVLVPERIYQFRFFITDANTGILTETENATIFVPLPVVVPPIYGRWHAAKQEVVSDTNANSWVNVLNLDPRHRSSAGLGAEVIKKQQEGLMASAWDQIGEIESANDILRRAQVGRESSIVLHNRFSFMAGEDFLRTTKPALNRILVPKGDGSKINLSALLENESKISACMDPAFRRISRARGPIRKRQNNRRMDMLRRITSGEIQPAGPHPRIEGLVTPCTVTKEMVQGFVPTLSLSVLDATATVSGGKGTLNLILEWVSTNSNSKLLASGEWSGDKIQVGVETIQKSWTIEYMTPDVPKDPENPINPGGGVGSPNLGRVLTSRRRASVNPFDFTGSDRVSNVKGTSAPQLESDSSGETLSDSSGSSNVGILPTGENLATSGDTPIDEGSAGFLLVPIPKPLQWTFYLTANSPAAEMTASVRVVLRDSTIPTDPEFTVLPVKEETKTIDASALRFYDAQIGCAQIQGAIEAGVQGIEIDDSLRDAVCDAFANFLNPHKNINREKGRKIHNLPVDSGKTYILGVLDPRSTIKNRAKARFRLNGDLAKRFDEGETSDPLDEVMAYPEFPQPMYEPLRDLSESHILPGVEKVPQNTIGLLETNRRFLEAYMVGLNHEFAGELLWRRYPTDQRGSYFRQFWDVSEYVGKEHPDPDQSEVLEGGELKEAIQESLKDISPIPEWGENFLGENESEPENSVLQETNENGSLVLIIRGDLLKRYPNAVIYSVNARLEFEDSELTGDYVPDLYEFEDFATPSTSATTPAGPSIGPEMAGNVPNSGSQKTRTSVHRKRVNIDPLVPPADPGHSDPIYPTFRGSLGADLVYLGFPFSATEAKSSRTSTGKFFIFEERISEARFGLDSSDEEETDPPENWDGLSWGHFQMAAPSKAGAYIDSFQNDIESEEEVWNTQASAALRARITLQKPARLAVHADQMIPENV